MQKNVCNKSTKIYKNCIYKSHNSYILKDKNCNMCKQYISNRCSKDFTDTFNSRYSLF